MCKSSFLLSFPESENQLFPISLKNYSNRTTGSLSKGTSVLELYNQLDITVNAFVSLCHNNVQKAFIFSGSQQALDFTHLSVNLLVLALYTSIFLDWRSPQAYSFHGRSQKCKGPNQIKHVYGLFCTHGHLHSIG